MYKAHLPTSSAIINNARYHTPAPAPRQRISRNKNPISRPILGRGGEAEKTQMAATCEPTTQASSPHENTTRHSFSIHRPTGNQQTEQHTTESLAKVIATQHPRLAAKTGYVTIECLEHARLVPSFLSPCLRKAHTALVIGKVLRSPLDFIKSVQKIATNGRLYKTTGNSSTLTALGRQLLSLSCNTKDIYKLLTKTQLLNPSPSLKYAIKLMSTTSMMTHFSWNLLDQAQNTPKTASMRKNEKLIHAGEALTHIAIAAILFDQIFKCGICADNALPWLSACTVLFGIASVYENQQAVAQANKTRNAIPQQNTCIAETGLKLPSRSAPAEKMV